MASTHSIRRSLTSAGYRRLTGTFSRTLNQRNKSNLVSHARSLPAKRSSLTAVKAFSSATDKPIDKSKNDTTLNEKPSEPKGLFDRLFGLESNEASPTFKNRWLMVLPAFATHMCIGTPWAWSLMADTCTREVGFVASAAADWSLMETALPLSIVFGVLGFTSASVGNWQIKHGARKAMAAASFAFGGGCVLGAAGIHFHSLPMLYAGYGVLAGIGVGLPYTPPVQALMQWFPDKKGLASGLTIAGFGSGALIFTPIAQPLMQYFAKMPEFLGPASDFVTKIQDGKLFADVNGTLVEVVQAGATEIAKLPYDLPEGLYVVGSGSTGAAEALAVSGVAMFGVMMASALAMRKPHSSYVVPGMPVATSAATTSPTSPTATGVVAAAPVPAFTIEEVVRKPQFYLLGTTFFCLATGGMGMFSVAKPMMSEVFSSAMPHIVTSAFAAQYVLLLSTFNLGGRLAWAALSDAIGRRRTVYLFTFGSVPLYLSMPTMIETVLSTGSTVPLYGFCLNSALAISIMGGIYAIMPAYESDLFGNRSVAAVHGRMLLFSSAAALTGPPMLLKLRSISEFNAITDLLKKVTPEQFEAAFGAPMEKASELITAKTLTISKLMMLVPPGTIDPTPHLYDTTMYTLAGMTATAVIAHGIIRPPVVPTPQEVIDVAATASTTTTSTITTTPNMIEDGKASDETIEGDRQVK